MANLIDPTEMMFTAFEPKVKNRYVFYVDGLPSYLIKKCARPKIENGEQIIKHINNERKIKGRSSWSSISIEMYDPIVPSAAQATMEWVRLHHESVTGRDGYSDFYKKDLTMNVLGPVGDIVSEWIIKGAMITEANFGDYNWDNESAAVELQLTVQPDYCILNF